MSRTFLTNFMHAAQKISHAERSMAVDKKLKVIDTINVDKELLNMREFRDTAMNSLKEALQTGQVIITNNRITDPAEAPITNTNFSDLRVLVALPLVDYGAIYMDQHISSGIMPKEMLEQLLKLAKYLIQNGNLKADPAQIKQIYQDLRSTS